MRKDAEKTEGSDLLVRLNKNYKTLSKGQKQLAAYITENYDRAAFITASKMGRIVGVSESTVVRFAYALGYDGYPELQKSLQELIRNKLTSVPAHSADRRPSAQRCAKIRAEVRCVQYPRNDRFNRQCLLQCRNKRAARS